MTLNKDITGTMQEVYFDGAGGPDVCKIRHVKVPVPRAQQVLIKVKAAGINRPDCLQREGNYPPPKGETEVSEVIRERLQGFLMRAFRKPVSNELLKRYLAHAMGRIKSGDSFTKAMKSAASAALRDDLRQLPRRPGHRKRQGRPGALHRKVSRQTRESQAHERPPRSAGPDRRSGIGCRPGRHPAPAATQPQRDDELRGAWRNDPHRSPGPLRACATSATACSPCGTAPPMWKTTQRRLCSRKGFGPSI